MLLDNYIKHDFVLQEFSKSCLIVSDISQAESIAKTEDLVGCNLLFESTSIKLAFFSKFRAYHPDIKIINCDSSKSRLLNDINKYQEYVIVFDKVNYCENFDIFNMINKMDRILIC